LVACSAMEEDETAGRAAGKVKSRGLTIQGQGMASGKSTGMHSPPPLWLDETEQ
jgi:hypothetical protein